MSIQLDHILVPARDKVASAKLLAELLGIPWSETGVGPFAPVYVNDGLTFDFDEWANPIPLSPYCFRVSQEEFDAILERIKAAGIQRTNRIATNLQVALKTEEAIRYRFFHLRGTKSFH